MDQDDQPVLGASFVVQFHWEIGNFWGPYNNADREGGNGYYYWDIPEAQEDQVDQWRALCPSNITPVSPPTQTVLKEIESTHFRWDVEVP